MINTIVIEDEPVALKHLIAILQKNYSELKIVATAGDVGESLQKIKEHAPDLVLMDIELGGESSFEILEQQTTRNYEVIFVTAHDEFGIKALKNNAVDYVLKPINKAELRAAVDKALIRIAQGKGHTKGAEDVHEKPKAKNEKIGLPTLEGLVFIEIEKIMYCESDGRYTSFYIKGKDKRVLVSKNIGEFEKSLEINNFVRIHHHTLVNLRYIEKYVKGRGGYVVLSNGTILQVSSRKRDELLERMR